MLSNYRSHDADGICATETQWQLTEPCRSHDTHGTDAWVMTEWWHPRRRRDTAMTQSRRTPTAQKWHSHDAVATNTAQTWHGHDAVTTSTTQTPHGRARVMTQPSRRRRSLPTRPATGEWRNRGRRRTAAGCRRRGTRRWSRDYCGRSTRGRPPAKHRRR